MSRWKLGFCSEANSIVCPGSTHGKLAGAGHKKQRSECLDMFEKLGDWGMPLVKGNTRVVNPKYWSPFTTAPCWLEYFAPL
eukprot:scaffold1190_cov393-Prasinococcus_capsulatus_cf.AAC.25